MKKVEFLFPSLVLILSILDILRNLSLDNVPSLIISSIGIIGVILFVFKNKWYKQFIYLWIISQIVEIPGIWDVVQALSFKFGISYTSQSGRKIGIFLNVLPFFYLVVFRVLQMSTIIGSKIVIKRYNKDSRIKHLLPVDGTVLKRVNLSGEREWILVDLDKPINLLNASIHFVLLKAEGEKPLQKSKKKQLSYFRIIEEPVDVDSDSFSKENTKFLDWVVIESK
jgi:hypothetical protein